MQEYGQERNREIINAVCTNKSGNSGMVTHTGGCVEEHACLYADLASDATRKVICSDLQDTGSSASSMELCDALLPSSCGRGAEGDIGLAIADPGRL